MTWIMLALCLHGSPMIVNFGSDKNKCEVVANEFIRSGMKCDFKCLRIK